MGILLGLMFLIGTWEALKYAGQRATGARRKSRGEHVKQSGAATPSARRKAATGHDIAWWAREAGHGFPVHRTGLHTGWLAHKTALDEHKAKRAGAKTSHLEKRASILTELREHRKRQRAAQERIDKTLEETGQEEAGRTVDCRFGTTDGDVPPLPAETVTRRVDGKPETGADKGFFDLRESGFTGPIDQDGKPVMSRTNGNGVPLPAFEGGTGTPDDRTTQPEGAPAVPGTAEMNYTAAHEAATQLQELSEASANDAKKIQDEADAAVNDSRAQRMSSTLEAVSGMLHDAPTLSEAAEVDDALRRDQEAAEALAEAAAEREKAAQQLSESAEQFRDGLEKRHGGIKEAVDDAPIDEPAEMPFYKGD